MFKSIKMAHFNEKGKEIQEPEKHIKINFIRKFGGWVSNLYPILKLRYFEDSNSWKSVESGCNGVDAAKSINSDNNINDQTSTKEWNRKLGGSGIQSFLSNAHLPKSYCNKNVIKLVTICKNRAQSNTSAIVLEDNDENKVIETIPVGKSNVYKFSHMSPVKDSSTKLIYDSPKALKKCHVQLSRLSKKQLQKYLGLNANSVASAQPPKREAPSRSSQPHNCHKRWKAWCQSTAKPTICGAHISTEATSGSHERHKKKILLKAVKLDKPLLLERSPKRSYNRKSPNKSSIQHDNVKLRLMKHNLFRENWIKNHSISADKENSRTCKLRVRKSKRITARRIKYELLMQERSKILSKCEDGIKMAEFEGKGRGVVTTRKFAKGDFVVEYSGELTTLHDALQRERLYEDDETIGCYMYFFSYNSTRYCVDATAETGHLGRLINHSRQRSNLVTKIVPILGRPYLALMAKVDLQPGIELLLDYGDRSREALEHHPWLRL